MRHASMQAALCIGFFMLSSRAEATSFAFDTTLSGHNEVPANSSSGTGSAIVTVDDVLQTMHVQITFAGLSAPTTAAHIHCCAPLGTNTSVATTAPAFLGFPLGVMSGSLDQTYDMTLATSYLPAFITNHGGTTASAFSTLLGGLNAGQAYLNIHTSNFPGGEIRGQLAAVPEPATWVLMLLGFGLVGGAIRRKQRQTVSYNFV